MKYISLPEDRQLDLILIGRVAVDFNPAPEEGFKPLSQVVRFKRYIGGSTVNTAIGVNRHGLKVGMIAKISDDQLGDFTLDYLNKEKNIDTSHIVRATNGEKIGLTFTEMKSENESSILMYRNFVSDLALDVDDIDYNYIKSAKAVLVSGTGLAESPSREAVLKAVLLAKRAGCIVIFDIDYRGYNWNNKDEISIYYSIVARNSDIIIGSREEFDLTERILVDKSLSDKESSDLWFREKAKILVIKHGKKGSCAYIKNGESYSVKPFPIKVRKGFGGGDGYASAFIYTLFNGDDIKKCLSYASAEASMMVKSNSSSDLPTTKELVDFITKNKSDYLENVTQL